MAKKSQKKKDKKKSQKTFETPIRGIVKLVLPEAAASKVTLKLKSEIEQLAVKIERQEEIVSSYLHDMSEPAEALGEKLMRERAVLEVVRVRLDQRKFEFEESQIADAEAALSEVAKHAARLEEEKARADELLFSKLCELYPSAEAKRLLKDHAFRSTCPITAPLIQEIESNEQKLRAAEDLVRKIRSEFFMNGTRSNGVSAHLPDGEDTKLNGSSSEEPFAFSGKRS